MPKHAELQEAATTATRRGVAGMLIVVIFAPPSVGMTIQMKDERPRPQQFVLPLNYRRPLNAPYEYEIDHFETGNTTSHSVSGNLVGESEMRALASPFVSWPLVAMEATAKISVRIAKPFFALDSKMLTAQISVEDSYLSHSPSEQQRYFRRRLAPSRKS